MAGRQPKVATGSDVAQGDVIASEDGGANPLAAAVSTATNWDQTATSWKDLAGVVCISG